MAEPKSIEKLGEQRITVETKRYIVDTPIEEVQQNNVIFVRTIWGTRYPEFHFDYEESWYDMFAPKDIALTKENPEAVVDTGFMIGIPTCREGTLMGTRGHYATCHDSNNLAEDFFILSGFKEKVYARLKLINYNDSEKYCDATPYCIKKGQLLCKLNMHALFSESSSVNIDINSEAAKKLGFYDPPRAQEIMSEARNNSPPPNHDPSPKFFFLAEEGAKAPRRATVHSAGYDLFPREEVWVPYGNEIVKVDTGIRVALPPGYVGKVHARSGYAFKENMQIRAGVIDSDYRGIVYVLLTCDKPRQEGDPEGFMLTPDKACAQLIVQKHLDIEPQQVKELSKFMDIGSMAVGDKRVRGTGGFGSTDQVQKTTANDTVADGDTSPKRLKYTE